MDKHVNNSNITPPDEEQLDWVEQLKPPHMMIYPEDAGRHLVIGATRAGKAKLRNFELPIGHGGLAHE
jgi:hypothetical protein